MVLGINMLIGGLGLIFVFQYASPSIKKDPIWFNGSRPNFFALSLRYVGPTVLSIILLGNLWYEFNATGPALLIRWGWFIAALICAILLSRIGVNHYQKSTK
jgi:NSS family neurotransmitter:Na+ symporter